MLGPVLSCLNGDRPFLQIDTPLLINDSMTLHTDGWCSNNTVSPDPCCEIVLMPWCENQPLEEPAVTMFSGRFEMSIRIAALPGC